MDGLAHMETSASGTTDVPVILGGTMDVPEVLGGTSDVPDKLGGTNPSLSATGVPPALRAGPGGSRGSTDNGPALTSGGSFVRASPEPLLVVEPPSTLFPPEATSEPFSKMLLTSTGEGSACFFRLPTMKRFDVSIGSGVVGGDVLPSLCTWQLGPMRPG